MKPVRAILGRIRDESTARGVSQTKVPAGVIGRIPVQADARTGKTHLHMLCLSKVSSTGVRHSALLAALIFALIGCTDDRPTELPYHVSHKYGVGDAEFQRTVGNLLGPPLVDGNSTTTLVNGQQIFPAMLEAIRGAKRTINFET